MKPMYNAHLERKTDIANVLNKSYLLCLFASLVSSKNCNVLKYASIFQPNKAVFAGIPVLVLLPKLHYCTEVSNA